jgi:hypothetical protein
MKFHSVITLAVFLHGSTGFAAIVTVNFAGHLTEVTPNLQDYYSVGQSFSGFFTYDTSATPIDDTSGIYVVPLPARVVTSTSTLTNAFPGSSNLQVSDGGRAWPSMSPFSAFSASFLPQGLEWWSTDPANGPFVGSYYPTGVDLYLRDSTGAALTGLQLPDASAVSRFLIPDPEMLSREYDNLRLTYASRAHSAGGLNAYGSVTGTFDSVTAVPEPAEWAMMGVGLGLVGCVARRRRRAFTGP